VLYQTPVAFLGSLEQPCGSWAETYCLQGTTLFNDRAKSWEAAGSSAPAPRVVFLDLAWVTEI